MAGLAEHLYRIFFQKEFRRSMKGNYWRKYEDQTLTVFQNRDGFYSWSIAGEYGPRYSEYGFETEQEALDSLQSEVAFNETFTMNLPKETK